MDTCLDQIRYMRELLDIEGLQERLLGYVELSVARRELPRQAAFLLRDVLLRGEVPRGEAARITGMQERSARTVVATLVERDSSSRRRPRDRYGSASRLAWFPTTSRASTRQRWKTR